jgi:ABC-type phosphate transport system permease subunit
MIQRIQSVWLLLAALCMGLLFKMPYYVATIGVEAATTELAVGKSLLLFILAVVLGVLALATIFLFRNRGTQKRLIWLGLLAALLLLALMYLQTENLLTGNPNNYKNESFKLGAVFPILYIILMFMAYSAIRRDDKLVKSIDRLRK